MLSIVEEENNILKANDNLYLERKVCDNRVACSRLLLLRFAASYLVAAG